MASVAVGMGGARNSGLFAERILATSDHALAEKIAASKNKLEEKIAAKDAAFQEVLRLKRFK